MAGEALRLRYPAGPTPSIPCALGASQTFKKGALVIWASGYITVAGTGPSVVFGVAEDDATSGTDGQYTINVIPISPEQIWEVSLVSADTLAQTDVGISHGLVVEDTFWKVDLSDSGDQVFTMAPVLMANEGVTAARRLLCKFDVTNIQDA